MLGDPRSDRIFNGEPLRTSPENALSNRRARDLAEAQQREHEEQRADDADGEEFRPDDGDPRAAVKDRLRED